MGDREALIAAQPAVQSGGAPAPALADRSSARCLSVCLDLSPSHGGSYRAAVDLAQAVASPILTFRDGTGALRPEPLDVPVWEVDTTRWSPWSRYFWPPRREAARLADLVGRPPLFFAHSLFRSHAAWVREVATSRRLPYVVIPHGSLDPWAFRRRWAGKYLWMRGIGRAYLQEAAIVMFSSDAERRKAEQTLGFAVRSVVVPWPVDVRPLRPSVEDKREARLQLGLPVDARVLLYFGRYHSMKRPVETVSAFLDSAPSGVMLVMAGMDGDVSADLLRAEVAEAASSRIRVLGPVFGERRTALLTAADAFVSWSHRENFCYAAAESMAFGRPVILSPGNDLRGALGGVRCGWFPETAEPGRLGDAIRQFAAATDTELDEMGVTAHVVAKKLFSRSGFVDAVRAIQMQLIT